MDVAKKGGRAIILHAKDNAATALELFSKDSIFHISETDAIILQDNIEFGHKFALAFIPRGQKVYKYGVPIGIATLDIHVGEHIHLHNLMSMQYLTDQSVDQISEGMENEGIQESGWKNRNT
ncbi:UxaA family hydrolase [Paenibacillus endoradicis]|uniref:UxaA family hydrolase n=1 Tax=Paenibacillus endoradicis TaxID=2972487 RepID=UPI00215909DF|nr:UxaA family hydrolase [Paenibacillus endoradicis]MCR8655944.1 UxaA family hydrolase [Paenibacillus endoradicis]MCR8658270.1 UxaA family hydrolase [Paenibacillus endoradicis]